MALRGNLRDFSLPDVFQLVTFSKKTGVLRIRRADGAEGSVWFREGEVFFAQSNWHGEPLGERLVAASRITPAALERALKIRDGESQDGRRLGQILVDEGYITEKVLEAFVQEQIQDTIFDLMRWDEGDFDFELLPEVVDEDIGLSVSIENVVMEGSRRLEEWTRIKKKVPSMEVVFKMATAPGEGTFEISLKPIEWELLLLVDGTRSVSELAAETSRTDFEVARIIYGLFSAGLLEFAADEEVERLRAERAERDKKLEAYRARKREIEEAAAREAMEREAALAAASAERRRADAAATPSETELADQERADSYEPHEEPEFLSGPVGEPTSEDMSVFEEVMGAVLEAPAAEAPPVQVEPVKRPPSAPVEEPGFLSATAQQVEPTDAALPEDVMDIVGLTDAPVVASETVDESPMEAETVPEVDTAIPEEVEDAVPDIVSEFTPEEEASSSAALEEEPEPVDDLAADLMALGLGEMPSEDLLAPLGAEESDIIEDVPQGVGADLLEAEEPQRIVEPDVLSMDEIEAIAAEVPVQDEVLAEDTEGEGAPDFSDLLLSLDETEVEAEESEAVDESAPDMGLVDELDRDSEPSGGVISTDAFLADIAPDELGFSGGLGDELSALTGAGRARPTASVNRIPEPGGSLELHRDQTVDKDLVLKIIEGLKDL